MYMKQGQTKRQKRKKFDSSSERFFARMQNLLEVTDLVEM